MSTTSTTVSLLTSWEIMQEKMISETVPLRRDLSRKMLDNNGVEKTECLLSIMQEPKMSVHYKKQIHAEKLLRVWKALR